MYITIYADADGDVSIGTHDTLKAAQETVEDTRVVTEIDEPDPNYWDVPCVVIVKGELVNADGEAAR